MLAKPGAEAGAPAPTFLQRLCCVELKRRERLNEWMILDDNAHAAPSLIERLLCRCTSAARSNSHIADVPQIRGLAGATLQRGPPDWRTSGSVQTLKWSHFDEEKRVATLQVFGGFGGLPSSGLWTEKDVLAWYCLINLGRLCNYSYRFEFYDDWRSADIKIMSNCCGCVPCCLPCCPAWCTVPDWLMKFNAVQVGEKVDGSHWVRNSSYFGAPMQYSYDLVEVVRPDGSPGAYFDDLAKVAPEAMLVSR